MAYVQTKIFKSNRSQAVRLPKAISVKEVIDTAREVTGCSIPVQIGPRRAGDPPRLAGDATRIRNELGWRPEFSDLKLIIETAWKWHKRNFKSKKNARSKKYKR